MREMTFSPSAGFWGIDDGTREGENWNGRIHAAARANLRGDLAEYGRLCAELDARCLELGGGGGAAFAAPCAGVAAAASPNFGGGGGGGGGGYRGAESWWWNGGDQVSQWHREGQRASYYTTTRQKQAHPEPTNGGARDWHSPVSAASAPAAAAAPAEHRPTQHPVAPACSGNSPAASSTAGLNGRQPTAPAAPTVGSPQHCGVLPVNGGGRYGNATFAGRGPYTFISPVKLGDPPAWMVGTRRSTRSTGTTTMSILGS
mmetsp:Transcript_92469/g.249536  ORF Transcript_92469/g.249536 Transcript_92469/m.249536 type:complete len:259 (+) Transcript_92469:202-978(+)